MHYESIGKEKWESYFNSLSKAARGREMQIEMIGLDIGDQIAEDWTPFEGLSYDQKHDTVQVHTQALDHAIASPEEVVAEENGALKSISIKSAGGALQIIHFRDPIVLDKN